MRIAVVTNLKTGKGLQRDYYLLRRLLLQYGHEVVGCQFDEKPACGDCDLVIFAETIVRDYFDVAPKRWVFPNPEWWFDHYDRLMAGIDRIMVKTKDAERLFAAYGDKVRRVGFMSEDRLDVLVPRKKEFIHVCGGSEVKNTPAILEAWKREMHKHAPLTVIGKQFRWAETVPGVTLHMQPSRSDTVRMQNEHLFHLCPSQYEGFGHYLHEALGCAAVVISVNHPPMNEWPCILIQPESSYQLRKATMATVSADGVIDACKIALSKGNDKLAEFSRLSRSQFGKEQREFAEKFRKELENI